MRGAGVTAKKELKKKDRSEDAAGLLRHHLF
jgi:hypothetical protein